jgi:hypothetical protein
VFVKYFVYPQKVKATLPAFTENEVPEDTEVKEKVELI